MAMQTLYIYNQFLNTLTNQEINIDTDELKVMLVTSAYSPNRNADKYKSSVTNEVAGEGYKAGGLILENVTYEIEDNIATLRAANPRWEELNITNLRYAVIYDNRPALDTEKPLIAYIDLGETLSVINAEIEIVWGLNGIMRFTIR